MKLDTLVKEDDCDGEFGSMTALQNEEDYRLFVGCPDDDTASGAVYYYKLSTDGKYKASLKQKITAPRPEPLYKFGNNVAVGGRYSAIGTYRDEAKLHEKVHIFVEWEDSWREVLVIDSPQGAIWFGSDIDIYDDIIMITSCSQVGTTCILTI
jgi:hypothetical protein